MLSPDNFVQNSESSQGYNRYSYCLNNPLKYTDPSGDIIAFTDWGYDFWKFVSPIAIKVNFNWSSEDKNIGFDASVGAPQISPTSARAQLGVSYHFDYYDNAYKGWEGRYGAEFGVIPEFKFGFTYYDFSGRKIDQETGIVTVGGPNINFKYENDYMFGLPSDNGNRYRTAAARLQVGPAEVGINLFTGDPGLKRSDRKTFQDPEYNNRSTYETNDLGNNPDEYRAGIFYVKVGPFRIGRNSEKIRHNAQNKFAHDFLMQGKSPYFKVDKTRKPEWYWNFGNGTGNSLW